MKKAIVFAIVICSASIFAQTYTVPMSANGTITANVTIPNATIGGNVSISGLNAFAANPTSSGNFSASTWSAATGAERWLSPAAAMGAVDATTMPFSLAKATRPWVLIDPAFIDIDHNFSAPRISTLLGSGYSAPTQANGIRSVVLSGGSFIDSSYATPRTPWFAVAARIEERPATSGVVAVGINYGLNNVAQVYYDGAQFFGQIKVSGTTNVTALTGTTVTLTAPYTIYAAFTGTVMSAWYDAGAGPVFAGSWDISLSSVTGGPMIDMTASSRYTGNLSTSWNYQYGFYGTGTGRISRFWAGAFGEVGQSSHYEVTYEDGTPIQDEDGSRYLAVTAAAPGSSSTNAWRSAYLNVYRWKPGSDEQTSVGKIFVSRSSRILGDSFGPLIFDRSAKLWRYFPQNTGDFGSTDAITLNCKSAADLRFGVNIVDGSTELALARGSFEAWDLAIRKSGSTWLAAYATRDTTPFWLALDSSTNIDGSFTRVSSDSSRADTEGFRWVKIGDAWRILGARRSAGTSRISIYDAAGSYVGENTPTNWPTGSAPPPHPSVFWYATGSGSTKYLILTFDTITGAGASGNAYGNRLIYEGPTISGTPLPVWSK